MVNIILWGAAGRMGRSMIEQISSTEDVRLCAAVEHPGHPALNTDIGTYHGMNSMGVVTSDIPQNIHHNEICVVDFSLPEGTAEALEWCLLHTCPLVTGTTGRDETLSSALEAAGDRIPILSAPNFSLGINCLLAWIADAARLLPEDFEVALTETHHKRKKDRPSGTARALENAVRDNSPMPRHSETVTLRIGDVIGRHTLTFMSPFEEISLSHTAVSRDLFAQGALTAAKWISGKKQGVYTMQDVLGKQ